MIRRWFAGCRYLSYDERHQAWNYQGRRWHFTWARRARGLLPEANGRVKVDVDELARDIDRWERKYGGSMRRVFERGARPSVMVSERLPR